jgi:hypothetical protein
MALIHPTGTGFQVEPVLAIGTVLAMVLAVHLVRALSVSPDSAERWAATRGLALTPRVIGDVERHLRRVHGSRFLGTAILGAGSLMLALLSQPAISFLSLPLLLGGFLAELLVPAPRRGRLRSVVLQRRSTSYFAPAMALRVTRVLLLAGVVLGGWGALSLADAGSAFLSTHVVVLLAGSAVLELTLRQLTSRGLPDRTDDLALDCALRVADARSVTAAALMFATIGLTLSIGPAVRALGSPVTMFASTGIPILIIGVCVWAFTLLQPLRRWRPA